MGRTLSAFAEYEDRAGRAASADELRGRARAIRKRAVLGKLEIEASEQALPA
jgi:hypothetical protein